MKREARTFLWMRMVMVILIYTPTGGKWSTAPASKRRVDLEFYFKIAVDVNATNANCVLAGLIHANKLTLR